NYVISIFAPLIIFASPNFILESSKAEVYTLNTFLIMFIFYFGLRAVREKNFFKYILISAFILGIGMGNHHTIGFMLIPILYVIIIRRKELPFGTVALSIILFLAGFSVYFYLYLRSLADAFINYSAVYSFRDFLTVFFSADYSGNTIVGIKGMSGPGIGWLYSIKNVGLILSKEMHPLIWFFVLSGIAGIIKDRKISGYILISMAIWLLLAKMTTGAKEPTYHDLFIVSPYFLQLVPIVAVIAAAGLFKCYEKIKVRSSFISGAVVAGLIIFQIIYVSVSIRESSLSDYFTAYNWIKDVSKVLKPKSFYFAFGDNPSFLGFYGFGIERLRDDVVYMDASSGSSSFRLQLSPHQKFFQWYPEFYKTERTSVKYFQSIARQGRLYASSIGSLPRSIKDNFDVRGYVLVSILSPKDSNFQFAEKFKNDFEKIDYLPLITGNNADILTAEVFKSYSFTVWQYADFLAAENTKDADYFYRLAIYIAHRALKYEIIKDYVQFLYEKKGAEAVNKFISELKDAVYNSDIKTKREVQDIEEWYKTQYKYK
ncbi:MAG: DUF2723 domain-containing protein, partial [Nitrospirae bacterium]|nr:DUF2723 domain-containing protein [Nitrospirota bacterium]